MVEFLLLIKILIIILLKLKMIAQQFKLVAETDILDRHAH